MKGIVKIIFIFCGLGVFAGCDKTNLQPITNLKIRLTDAPINAQEVNINIKEVRINLTDDTTWTILRTNTGHYNLLDYKNGKDTLIAEGNVAATRFVKEVRLILGDSNTIKINNQVYPLNMADALANDVKVSINTKLNKNIETFTIDFDAALSIIETTKGSYQLKPMLSFKKEL